MRTILFLLIVSITLYSSLSFSESKKYPSRPIRLIVANGPGSSPDVIARIINGKLSELLGQPVIVDNRPGATGLIAVELLAKSTPDGHTLFLSTMTQLISMIMYQKYLLASELSPVTLVGTTPFAIVINASIPVRTIPEWIAYARPRQNQINYGSGGLWGSSHLCIEAFNSLTGLKITHIPYPSTGATVADLISGNIQMYCPAAPSLPAINNSGKLRVLGVTYLKPTKLVPGIPPISDSVPGFELLGWYGINVALHTPPDIISKLNLSFNKVLKNIDVQERMFAVGTDAIGSTPEWFSKFLRKDTDHWTKILNESGASIRKE